MAKALYYQTPCAIRCRRRNCITSFGACPEGSPCPDTDDLLKCTGFKSGDKFPCYMTASGCKKRTDYLIDKCRKMLYTVQTTNDSSLIITT